MCVPRFLVFAPLLGNKRYNHVHVGVWINIDQDYTCDCIGSHWDNGKYTYDHERIVFRVVHGRAILGRVEVVHMKEGWG